MWMTSVVPRLFPPLAEEQRLTRTPSPGSGTESRSSSSSSPMMMSPSPQSRQLSGREKETVPPLASEVEERALFSAERAIRDDMGSGTRSPGASGGKVEEEEEEGGIFSFQLEKSETFGEKQMDGA